MKGKFIVFEGIDGSGKTTQLSLLQEKLEIAGIKSIITAEPTPGPIGVLLRNIQQGKELLNPSPKTMAFLYAADRNYHVDWINSKLEEGVWVLCDRYKYSSLAYQGNGDLDLIDLVEDINKNFPDPDHAFLLNISPDISLTRTNDRVVREIFEKKEFLEKVASNYKNIFLDSENRSFMSVIDASNSKEEVSNNIFNILQKKYRV